MEILSRQKIARPGIATKHRQTRFLLLFVQLLTGGILVFCNPALAENYGLPVSPNPIESNHTIPDLTSPALHPGVDVGSASAIYSSDGHKLTIDQTTNNVILDWNSFNIAAGNTVQFVQPGSSSVALNDIHQLDASQIFGNLTANGQVFLVNNNGFVFGPNASVNLNTLVATTLSITDSVFQQGIATLNQNATNSTPVAAFAGTGQVYLNTGNGTEKISILVEKGAQIHAADSGRVILAAPQVENDGTITAPDGQVILVAATDQVYLQESSNPNLRGLLVAVKTGGDVKNLGTILTERGNTTMMGFAVSQQGIVSASTSVALNGSVRLLAQEGASLIQTLNGGYLLEPLSTSRSGDEGDGLGAQATVTLGTNSSTTVTLDDSGGTATAAATQPQSIVDVEGGYIDMQSGSNITAHGGIVNLLADQALTKSNQNFSESQSATLTTSSNDINRILLETGSSIDVSGVQNVVMPMSSNVISLNLYSYELRNDPTQQHGILYGQNVYVDTRIGTGLADISGAEAGLQYSVEYRNANAGTVNLVSSGDVIIEKGANINISGGYLDYLAGAVQATELSSGGNLYSMGNASQNLSYQSIFNVSEYLSGYLQGMNAGSVNIISRDVILDGNISATTVNGEYQRYESSLANGGNLSIDTAWTGLSQQDVIFQNQQTYTSLPAPGGFQTPMYLSNALFSNGLNNLTLNVAGNITVSQNTNLIIPEFGSLIVQQAGTVDILGGITAPNGTVSFSSSTGSFGAQSYNGEIHMAAGSFINTSGVWINDPLAFLNGQGYTALDINGGNISLSSGGDLLLDKGAVLAANGGAWLQQSRAISGGNGGNISLSTVGNNTPTAFELNANLSSYSLTEGGVLSIVANSLFIEKTIANPADYSSTLNIAAGLLESGGFSNYKLTANSGDLTVAANTDIVLQQSNWQLTEAAYQAYTGAYLNNLSNVYVNLESLRNPVNLTLNLAQSGSIGGYNADDAIIINKNAQISTDPSATVSLNSDANIFIDGAIDTPSGSINMTLDGSQDVLGLQYGYSPNQGIFLESSAILDAAGTTVMTPNTANLSLGNVLSGGTISLTANRGYIVTDSSSTINVSGTNAMLDIANSHGLVLENIASSAGAVNLTAAEGLDLQGSFQAQAGFGQTAAGNGSAAAGGSLNLVLDAENRNEPVYSGGGFPTSSRIINVSSQAVTNLSSAEIDSGVIPGNLNGQAYISTYQIAQGGFGSLKLATLVENLSSLQPSTGSIIFDGDITLNMPLSLTLDTPLISHEWLSSGDTGKVTLTADMFSLGSSQNQTALGSLSNPDTAYYNHVTPAIFSVTAQNIELQGASLISGFAKTSLISTGNIDLVGVVPAQIPASGIESLIGSLSLTGELDLSAREIFPSTLSQFSISINQSLSPDGLIKILPADAPAFTPLSAGGEISIAAPTIDSYGNLAAPFGVINLTATTALELEKGSLTTVSDLDKIVIPFGVTLGSGAYWSYPIGNDANILSGAPQKSITLTAPNIQLLPGSEVNLNGGGDLQAYELLPAPGGSIDYLSAGYQQNYVVLPGFQSGFAPYDYLQNSSGSGLGEDIHLSAGADGLAAGNYVLLPSYYAFLPGAYLITPVANTNNLPAGTATTLTNGIDMVSGYLQIAGSNVSSSTSSGFEVQSGNVALSYSPYQLSYASQFFAANAAGGTVASQPQDAGDLSLQAQTALTLTGEIYASASAGGLGGQLDISGNNFDVVNQAPATLAPNTLLVYADQLNKLGVDSILIGGYRSRNSSGANLTVTADNVEVAANVQLYAPEIILAAIDNVTVNTGANIYTTGTLSHTDTVLNITDSGKSYADGVLLRVSAAEQASVVRSSLNGLNSSLDIETGATLQSSGSMLIDTSDTGSIQGNIIMNQGQLTLSGNLITLGGTANANSGFQLSETTLNNLNVANLTLNSYSTVDIASAINLQLVNLSINAGGIVGEYAKDLTATIHASNITLQNTNNAGAGLSGSGNGNLVLHADNIYLNSGSYNLSGFKQVNLTADSSLIDSGESTIALSGDLNISTPIWTANAGADTHINMAANNLTIDSSGSAQAASALGASLAIAANQITDQGYIDMAAGNVSLSATNNLTIAGGGVIDTSGQVVNLGGNEVYTGGGNISLNSTLGNIDIQSGSTLNVSGSVLGGNAGSLTLNAANNQSGSLGIVSLDGSVSGMAHNGATGGNFSLTANSFNVNADSSFSTLYNSIKPCSGNSCNSGGFDGNLLVHQMDGNNLNVAQSDHVAAKNISLTADQGIVDVAGALNVSGAQGGTIALSGNNGVTIESTASLNASSSNSANQGGTVVLTAAPVSGANSTVTINGSGNSNHPATINVSGGSGGAVQVIVNATQDNGSYDHAAVNIAQNAVSGANNETVYAMVHYLNMALSDDQFQNMLNTSNAFLTNAASNTTLQNNLGGFNLAPGIDIVQTSGDLNWNIATALTGQVTTPGLLSIRTAGSINIDQSISDGFTVNSKGREELLSGPSWSYNIVAGADLNSANLQDAGQGLNDNLTIASETTVRTGSGNIFMAAAGNIVLTDQTSTIFTAGQPGHLTDPYLKDRATTYLVQYPDAGGDVTLNANGNIIGAATTQLMSDWLQRSGNLTNAASSINRGNYPTAWGIDFGTATPTAASNGVYNSNMGFQENIGALGGGNVNIHAGNNINDLSVMLPTNAVANVVNGVSVLQKQGGGNLIVSAGGNIAGGVFYVENGTADIHAQGAITGGSQYTSGPVFAMGNAQFNVSAETGIAVSGVLDAFVVGQAGVSSADYFTTYTAQTGINLQSFTGDINLNNNINLISSQVQVCLQASCNESGGAQTSVYNTYQNNAINDMLAIYPGNLTVDALSGGINVNNSMSLYPAADSSLNLLAAQDINIAANVSINQMDVNPSLVLPDTLPAIGANANTSAWVWSTYSYNGGNAHAAQPIHAADTTPNLIVSGQGSIIGGSNSVINTAKSTDVSAAQNLTDVSLIIQNLGGNYQDISSIVAGGDISFPITVNPINKVLTAGGNVVIAGPGSLNVWAGGNVNLGDSTGIDSVGNLYNPGLSSSGSSITVLAGAQLQDNSQPIINYQADYIDNTNYQNALLTQLQSLSQQPSSPNNTQLKTDLSQLLTDISTANIKLGQADSAGAKLQLLLPVLFDQFNLAATEDLTGTGGAAYQAGYDAINVLFPDKPAGNIILDFSTVQTQYGGNVNLLAPGGLVNIGLASSDLVTNKPAYDLGVIAEGQGNVNILSGGDIQVNQSRVFTLDAGDITAWSSYGNIDAGRGAKSSLGAQLPIANYDAYGNLALVYPATVSGSGIRAQSGYDSNAIGNVTLIAPAGVVNADEAGIGGNNVTIAAVAVIGASNIQATGSTLGVPVTQTAVPNVDSSASAAAGVTKSAMLSTLEEDMNANGRSIGKTANVVLLNTQLIGFGNCSISDVRDGVGKCGGK